MIPITVEGGDPGRPLRTVTTYLPENGRKKDPPS
jgi:hypothetical protein